MSNRRRDLAGQPFGRLTAIRPGKSRRTRGGHLCTTWLCRCACGSPAKEVLTQCLTRGNTRSCGCLEREQRVERFAAGRFTHRGERRSPEFCANLSALATARIGRPVVSPDGTSYPTIKAAALAAGVAPMTVSYRARHRLDGWRYADG